jgi:hypothetical protein
MLVHPPDQLALGRAVVVVVLHLLKRSVDHHPELEPAAATSAVALPSGGGQIDEVLLLAAQAG